MDIVTYCEYTYNFTYIPTYIYTRHQMTAQIHSYMSKIEPPAMIVDQILMNNDPISFYESAIGSYYGQITIRSQCVCIILGPVFPLKYTENNLHKFFCTYNIPVTEQEPYQHFLSLIPSFSLISFVTLLYQMSYAMTDVKSDLPKENLAPYHLHGLEFDEMPATAEFTSHNRNNLEKGYHNTLYEAQQRTMPMVANGDLEGLIHFSKNQIPMNYGTFSDNLREQQLVVFIITITNAVSAAIKGGLDQQTALSMAELYIKKGLKLASPAEIDTLSMNAIVDFTTCVRKLKYSSSSSIHPSIYDCIQYIRERVYTPITVSEIADFSGYSLEHFSRLFKKETGFNANEFILNCKLYETKKLLKFTNMTVGEISSQLYFSNQSHFQRAFKAKFQMTPLKFRNSDTQI